MSNWDFLNDGMYKVTKYRKNGNKNWERSYQNGKLHGKYIEWYENGKVSWEQDYQNDKLHGKCIEWYKNGQKCREYYYWKGKQISKEEYNSLSNPTQDNCDGKVVEIEGKKYRLKLEE